MLVEPSVHTLGREAGAGEGEEPKVAHPLCRGRPHSLPRLGCSVSSTQRFAFSVPVSHLYGAVNMHVAL